MCDYRERILSEIIVTATNEELKAIKTTYAGLYDRELIDHINSEVSGDYEAFLVQCLNCGDRDEAQADDALAAEQAAALLEASAGFGTTESVFVEILGKSSVAQIDLIEQAFEAANGKSLKATIKGEMGGDLEWAMLLRLQSQIDNMCYLLHEAMEGMGTNEDTVARVLGSADKADVLKIHARYDEKYSANLIAELESELGSNLKSAVLKWMKQPGFTEEVAECAPLEDSEAPEGTVEAALPKEVVAKPNQPALPTPPPGTSAFYVTCPPGVEAGASVLVNATGVPCLTTIPAGVASGQSFIAYLPIPAEGVPPYQPP